MSVEHARASDDPFFISRHLPRAVAAGDVTAAYDLGRICGEDMAAERMAALLLEGRMSNEQLRTLCDGLCPGLAPKAAAQLGALAFSFPIWRFLTQRGQSMDSIIEAAGYQRLSRPTDLRDAALPDPARDALGVGFVRSGQGVYMEYRRAYLLYGDASGALLVRNSSYFFGRDRLRHAVYVSPRALAQDVLESLTPEHIDSGDVFSPLHQYPDPQRVAALVAGMVRQDAALQDWVWGEGLCVTLDFLRDKQAQRRGMPYLGVIDKGWPAWCPRRVVALDAGIIDDITQGIYAAQDNERIVMLSGPGGDFPL